MDDVSFEAMRAGMKVLVKEMEDGASTAVHHHAQLVECCAHWEEPCQYHIGLHDGVILAADFIRQVFALEPKFRAEDN